MPNLSKFDARNANGDNAITPDFLNAIRVYRSADDVALSLADQFHVIADRIEEDKPTDDLAPIRQRLLDLIDATNTIENTAAYRSPEHIAATTRGNALRIAVKALEDA